MSPRKIAVYLKEETAAVQLTGYWSKKVPQYRFEVFSDAETAVMEMQEAPFYLLITDEESFAVFRDQLEGGPWAQMVGRVVFLVEDECTALVMEGESYPCVFRYQSADQILAEAIGMREERGWKDGPGPRVAAAAGGGRDLSVQGRGRTQKTAAEGKTGAEETEPHIIGVYSPVGRCGKSRFALALGHMYGEQKRTLFLSLEVFSDLYTWTAAAGGGDFSDLLYYGELGKLTPELWKRLAVERDGVHIVGPASNPEDVACLSQEVFDCVLMCARESGFDVIVVDFGCQNPDPASLLGCCDHIYVPVTGEEVSRLKWEHCEAYLRKNDRAELLSRMETVKLPETGCGYRSDGLPEFSEGLEHFVRRLVCCKN